jgi:Family of unknown function (DUF6325)
MLDFPLEYALVVFPGNKFSGEIVPALLDLAERDIIRFVDIVFVQKDEDGSTRTVELNDLDTESYQLFVPLGKRIESLFTEDDLTWAASQMPENSSAALFLWENLWMGNIRNAISNSGGILAQRGQIPDDVIEQFKNRIATGQSE